MLSQQSTPTTLSTLNPEPYAQSPSLLLAACRCRRVCLLLLLLLLPCDGCLPLRSYSDAASFNCFSSCCSCRCAASACFRAMGASVTSASAVAASSVRVSPRSASLL